MSNRKVIFTCIDNSFLDAAVVWLSSLDNNVLSLTEESVDVIIFHSGDLDVTNLTSVGVGNIRFVRIETPTTQTGTVFDLKTTEAMTLRISALDVLRMHEYVTAYYFDSDTTLLPGSEEIFDCVPTPEEVILATPDYAFEGMDEVYKKRCRDYMHRKTICQNYFNSGVMVINIPAMSSLLAERNVASIVEAYRDYEHNVVFPDQDFLNSFFSMHGLLERKFNAFPDFRAVSHLQSTELLDEVWFISQAPVVHWLSCTKPWVGSDIPLLARAIMPYHLYINEAMKVEHLLSQGFVRGIMATYHNNRVSERATLERGRCGDIALAGSLFSNCI